MIIFKIVKKKKIATCRGLVRCLHNAEGFLSFSPTQNSSFQLRKLRPRIEV